MSDLNDMVIFAKVAQLQGISPAARALGVPKSKVSRRMAALEDELGVGLLERSTRSVHLTEVGEIYYQHCKRIVEEASSAVESVNRLLEAPRGHLRVSASVTIGQHLLAPLIGEFMAEYPEIEVEINLTNRRVDLISEGYDVVVRVGELQDSALISKRLCDARAMLFASPDYLDRFGTPKRVKDLEQHHFLVMGDASHPGQWTLVGPRGHTESLTVQPRAVANDLTMIRQMAADGGGVAILPEYLGRPYEKSGRLHRVLSAWSTPPFAYHVLYPSHRGATPKIRAWIDFLLNKLGLEGAQ